MNKNCVILEITPGENNVWPILQDYDSFCVRYTEDEAVAETDRLNRTNPKSRYQVVILTP